MRTGLMCSACTAATSTSEAETEISTTTQFTFCWTPVRATGMGGSDGRDIRGPNIGCPRPALRGAWITGVGQAGSGALVGLTPGSVESFRPISTANSIGRISETRAKVMAGPM
jgi:hypothetical protein